MQNSTWISLLHRIPSQHHDNLVIMMADGTLITVQHLLRVDEEFLVVRGRPVGSTEQGRHFFIPYNQITYINFYRTPKDVEVYQMFGMTPPEAIARSEQALSEEEAPPLVEEEPPAETPEPVAEEAPPAPPPPTPAPAPTPPPQPARAPLAGKSAILERLRARAAGQGPPNPPQK